MNGRIWYIEYLDSICGLNERIFIYATFEDGSLDVHKVENR